MNRPWPPTYCLTLRQTPAREQRARAYFESLRLPVRWCYGVHGASWGLATEKKFHEGYRVGPGYLGNLLSHYLLWFALDLAVCRSPADEALVLEDDAYFGAASAEDFAAEFWRTYDALPPDWHLWYVGTVGTEAKQRVAVNDRLCRVADGVPFGTHAYLVRQPALGTLLHTMQEVRAHVDIQIAQNALPHLHWYVSWPNLARQHSYEGDWERTV